MARRVSDPHLAADLTADVFLAAVDSAPSYDRSSGPVVAWLYGVGRNAIAAEARRRARELHAVRRIEGRRLVDGSALARIEERLDAERESRRLYRAIAELSPDDRALLELVVPRRALDRRRGPSAGGEAGHRAGSAAPQPGPGHRSPARAGSTRAP